MSKVKSPKGAEVKIRYNFMLPQILHDEISEIAKKHGTSVTEIIRRCLKIGLLLEKSNPNTQFIVKDLKEGTERQIVLL